MSTITTDSLIWETAGRYAELIRTKPGHENDDFAHLVAAYLRDRGDWIYEGLNHLVGPQKIAERLANEWLPT